MLWPVSDRATGLTEGLRIPRKPSVNLFGEVRDPRRARAQRRPACHGRDVVHDEFCTSAADDHGQPVAQFRLLLPSIRGVFVVGR